MSDIHSLFAFSSKIANIGEHNSKFLHGPPARTSTTRMLDVTFESKSCNCSEKNKHTTNSSMYLRFIVVSSKNIVDGGPIQGSLSDARSGRRKTWTEPV